MEPSPSRSNFLKRVIRSSISVALIASTLHVEQHPEATAVVAPNVNDCEHVGAAVPEEKSNTSPKCLSQPPTAASCAHVIVVVLQSPVQGSKAPAKLPLSVHAVAVDARMAATATLTTAALAFISPGVRLPAQASALQRCLLCALASRLERLSTVTSPPAETAHCP
jgi:hypothetical protein